MAGFGFGAIGRNIPKAVKVAAQEAFGRSPLGQVIKQAQNARRLLGVVSSSPSTAAIQQIGASVGAGDVAGLTRALSQADPNAAWAWVERYAASGANEHRLLHGLLNSLGPVGRVLATLLPDASRAGYGGLGQNLSEAIGMMRAFGDQPEVLDALEQILTGAGAQVTWPNGKPTRAAQPKELPPVPSRPGKRAGQRSGDQTPEEQPGRVQGISTGATAVTISEGGAVHSLPADHPALTGAWIETPESSNVFAFSFDIDAHRLYVRFKDRAPKGEKVRSHEPGAIYAYYNVPLTLFQSMLDAGSKGGWVWDNLRIRGTVSGHRYDYSLVGVSGGYVPRKATMTPEGESYIGRTVFSDRGRQLRSSRPDQLVRPLQPVGRPPNTGRRGLGGT